MESLQTEDGQLFIRSLANFIRQHEKALANSLQLSVSKRQAPTNASTTSVSTISSTNPTVSATTSGSSLAAAFSFAGLNFMSHTVKPAHLTLTPHHLFYLLSRIEELGIAIGPMNVRLENIHTDPSHNYVSFLQSQKAPKRGRSDKDSIHSVSSVRSAMSGMSNFWSSLGLGSGSSKSEKVKAAIETDLKYLYSAFTKLPSLRLAPDHRARLIKGYEEFPFDTAVPLFAFKNVQHLEIIDMDFRQFYGWDRLAEQLCLLTVKRARVDDPADLITNIVLDDAEKRRKRSNRGGQGSPTSSWTVPSTPRTEFPRSNSDPGSPVNASPRAYEEQEENGNKERQPASMSGSVSPKRPSTSRPTSSYRHIRTYSSKAKRSGSGSSNSGDFTMMPHRSESVSNLTNLNILPASKWQRLKYLSLADNSLTFLTAKSILPLASSLRSLNLASNLFSEIPDSLASLTRLTSLDLSNCMIESLQSLTKNPLPAILTLKLKSNRLQSLAGIERLPSLENLNVQDNQLSDPVEAARLTGIPNLRRIWVKNNPFTKRHTDYRITIFNLFRKTPGYLDDILIDDYAPGYTERKQLVERVPEVERPLPIRTVQILEPPVVIQHLEASAKEAHPDVISGGPKTTSLTAEPDTAPTSTRRRRGARRRIVDLSRDDSTTPATLHEVDIFQPPEAPRRSLSEDTAQPGASPQIYDMSDDLQGLNLDPGRIELPIALARGLQDDDYRSRVEALRHEFGNNWISVLSDQSWHGKHLSAAEMLSNALPTLHRANSHAIATGGRTLG